MEQRLFTELRWLYTTTKDAPCEIRIRMRMQDPIDPDALRIAVDATMKRYPYFCVELQRRDGGFVFAENRRPVVITNSACGVELSSERSNYHMIAFSWWDSWIQLDVFHGMTDGTGAYEVIRTLLYHYCSERYQVALSREGIRLSGDEIAAEEWADPVAGRTDLPTPARREQPKALCPVDAAGLQDDNRHTTYSIAISEDEFMQFVTEHNGSPTTMVSLLLGRALARLFPDPQDVIRISLCVDQRAALHAPLAHQTLVGAAMLEYTEDVRKLPIEQQTATYRKLVSAQTQEDVVLAGVATQSGIAHMLLAKDSDQERVGVAAAIGGVARDVITASVSYVGKANFGEAERYVSDFSLWTTTAANGLTIEISAVNGRFTLDFLQVFSSPIFVNAFVAELEGCGIAYDLRGPSELKLANIQLPWT